MHRQILFIGFGEEMNPGAISVRVFKALLGVLPDPFNGWVQAHTRNDQRIGNGAQKRLCLFLEKRKRIGARLKCVADQKENAEAALSERLEIFLVKDNPHALFSGADGCHHRGINFPVHGDGGAAIVTNKLCHCVFPFFLCPAPFSFILA
jgi:hypothetical protein